MPKQIKTKSISKEEKKNRMIALGAMLASFLLGALLLAMMKAISGDKDPAAPLGICCFISYIAFLVLTAAHFVSGIIIYHKQENYGVLFSSIGSGISAFAALLNIRFELSLLFSSVGADGLAKKAVLANSCAAVADTLLPIGAEGIFTQGFIASLKLLMKK